METIDNINRTVAEDLKKTVKKGSKVSIASACFSIYAFEALKTELKNVESLRFIFTSPTFLEEKIPREKKEFYIPRLSRERSVYGTEFEVRLRNGLTQKALARECADWIKRKVEFRSNVSYRQMDSMLNVESGDERTVYRPINEFTTVGIGSEKGDSISMYTSKFTGSETESMFRLFDQIWNNKSLLKDVKEDIIEKLTEAYDENSPEFIYFVTLYNIFSEFLEDISEDNLPKEGTGFRNSKIWSMLYSFQKDAALGIINKMETYNGCILADSVGLGKTFTALAVIKYYEARNKDVLVLCPKKLSENWNLFKNNYRNNPVKEDRFRYTVLYHSDLSRRKGKSNGIDLGRFQWDTFDLVVIDESHNFRNGGNSDNESVNRYNRLLTDVIRPGVKTKVLMLSATPVNNRFYDLYNQLKIAYEGDPELIGKNLQIDHPLETVFRDAQGVFNKWSKLNPEERTTENLLNSLDYEFFQVLDAVTIARSRKHIERYYGLEDVGRFPTRLKPLNLSPGITDADIGVTFKGINDSLQKLNLEVYVPTDFILASKKKDYGLEETNISRAGREQGIRRLMGINLLKRLESSIHSFTKTAEKVLFRIEKTLDQIERYEKGERKATVDENSDDLDEDDEAFAFERDHKIKLEDMDFLSWKHYLESDKNVLKELLESVKQVTPQLDKKLQTLKQCIYDKIANPINPGNRKILIFTTFTDTADYLYNNLSEELKSEGLNIAEITGTIDGKNTLTEIKGDFNDTLTWFSPRSKKRDLLDPDAKEEIDVLIGTDCISEGQNLQDCDYCINYDIHWNPVRIIQRFGRIDRIGSTNDKVQLVNFWPDVDLDEYIDLRRRVESRMKASVLTSSGDDNLLDENEKGDLEYRKNQLQRLKDEVVDIEEMQSGVSIMDLGLNEFRVDLLDYTRTAGELDGTPHGLHAVVPSGPDMPPGAIFVLLNRVDRINHDKKNRLHPFYMVYIGNDRKIVCDHLNPKKLLDLMRYACKGKKEIYKDLCRQFNEETNDGKSMSTMSELLSESIDSIMDLKEQSELDDFLSGRDSFSTIKSNGLDDFELICFLVVRRCSDYRPQRRPAGRYPRTPCSPNSTSPVRKKDGSTSKCTRSWSSI